jgi:hypothetical protein
VNRWSTANLAGRRVKQPPLTEYCTWLSEPANLLKGVNGIDVPEVIYADPSRDPDKIRAQLLCMVVMGAAGKFDLRGDARKEKLGGGKRRSLCLFTALVGLTDTEPNHTNRIRNSRLTLVLGERHNLCIHK